MQNAANKWLRLPVASCTAEAVPGQSIQWHSQHSSPPPNPNPLLETTCCEHAGAAHLSHVRMWPGGAL